MLPHLRNSVSELLFALCDQDGKFIKFMLKLYPICHFWPTYSLPNTLNIANLFIRHVGYGNAAGFLMSKNILIPPSSASSSNTTHSDKPINPITGQYYDDEFPSLSNMTDEEKEREAEKLFILFERLKKTGVMDVVNPVEEAIKSGKIQEYEEKEEDDDD